MPKPEQADLTPTFVFPCFNPTVLMSAPDLLSVFNAQPGATLLLSPEWVIVGASDDYIAATLTERDTLVGQYIFDAFPDNPATPEANGVANVRASLAQVLATKQPHEMAPQHYDVPDRTQPGHFVERHWQPRHTPVLDAAGQVLFIIQSVQDITASRLAAQQLRESQAAEQAARAETETQRQRLYHILENFPAVVASYRGPEHVFDLVSHRFQRDFPTRTIKGLPVRQALPELEGQQYYEILDGVYQTGVPFYGTELETWVDLTDTGQLERQYYNVCFQATRDAEGRIDGILNFAYDVTDAVLARQQLEQLNQELEARVQARTRDAEQQRRQWEQLFLRVPAAICIFNGPDWVYEFINPGYQAMFPGRELLGKPLLEALPELHGQPLVDVLRRVYDTGETFQQNEVLVPLARTATGPVEDIYFDLTYLARYDEQGCIDGFVTYAHDVTEQVHARREREAMQAERLAAAELRAQEREAQRAQLQAVFAQAPVAVCVFRGEDSVFEVVNPPMAELLGHPLEDLVGHPFFEVMPELRAQGLPELLAGVRRTGRPYVAQEQAIQLVRHRPGVPGHYNFVYQPLFDAQHRVTGIVCVVTDVSEQVAARRVVEAREESFRLMADNVPAMLWVTDPAGQCTYLNQQWYAYTGQTEAEALGLGWTQAVHPDNAAAAGAAFLDANARQAPFNLLYRLRRHDGRYRWAIDRGLPRFGADGAYEGIVGTVVDVHEQKLAELALQKLTKKLRKSRDQAEALNAELGTSNEQLVRTNADLDNFIYTASHDLKAPISNIEGLLYLLQEELLPAVSQDAEVGATLTRMLGAVERFKRTIEHLTEVSKLQKEHNAEPAAVNLADVVEDVRQDLTPLLQANGAKVVVNVPALPAIQFSEKNLRSIVYNLLSNAVKYRDPARPAQVWLRAEAQP